MTSELTFSKLATRVSSRLSYSLGSMMRASVDWMLEKNEVSTVPISRMYNTLWWVFSNR